MECRTCHGTGRWYSAHLYDGVAECSACQGSGVDEDTPCPAACGRTYGDHLDRDEIPEDCEGRDTIMTRLVTLALVASLALTPISAEAAGRKLAGALVMGGGIGLMMGAFNYKQTCPYGYSTHTFQGATTQCVYVSRTGSDVRDATTDISFERPALLAIGGATFAAGLLVFLWPKKSKPVVDLVVSPSKIMAAKTIRWTR